MLIIHLITQIILRAQLILRVKNKKIKKRMIYKKMKNIK